MKNIMKHGRIIVLMTLCLLSVASMSGCILRKKRPDQEPRKQSTQNVEKQRK